MMKALFEARKGRDDTAGWQLYGLELKQGRLEHGRSCSLSTSHCIQYCGLWAPPPGEITGLLPSSQIAVGSEYFFVYAVSEALLPKGCVYTKRLAYSAQVVL